LPTQDYHLFKEGIKPAWEDTHNARGGLWMMRLKKGLASRCAGRRCLLASLAR
jgi:translation initiation factor 4E